MDGAAKSLGSAFIFTSVAWLSDIISAGLASLQINVVTALLGGPQAIATGAVVIIAAVADFVLGTEIITKTAAGFAIFFGLQAIVSLLTLCVFYALVLASPKGTYKISDCLAAAGIFLVEAMPFLGGFVSWGVLAAWVQNRRMSSLGPLAVTGNPFAMVPKDGAADGGGGLKGVMKKTLGSFKR